MEKPVKINKLKRVIIDELAKNGYITKLIKQLIESDYEVRKAIKSIK